MPTAVQMDRVIVPWSHGGGPLLGASGTEVRSEASTGSATSPSSAAARRREASGFHAIQLHGSGRCNRACRCLGVQSLAMTFRGWKAEALEFFDGLEDENTKA